MALDLAAHPQVVAGVTYQRHFQAWWQAAGFPILGSLAVLPPA